MGNGCISPRIPNFNTRWINLSDYLGLSFQHDRDPDAVIGLKSRTGFCGKKKVSGKEKRESIM
jgi:hypothetical protein